MHMHPLPFILYSISVTIAGQYDDLGIRDVKICHNIEPAQSPDLKPVISVQKFTTFSKPFFKKINQPDS